MFAIRDKSVVRSSVIPSARYCWSGSLLRLANGSTTIDNRGAAGGCAIDVVVAATVATSVVAGFVAKTHQAAPAKTSAAAAIAARFHGAVRRRGGAAAGTFASGNSEIVSGRSA